MSKPLVTIGIPVYKRLEFLPNVLRVVSSQDYPNIELLVSDNGLNGGAVPKIVDQHYIKPYRFRQNSATVSCSSHFNELIHGASGEYVVILADDDEITPNFVSDLYEVLQRNPGAAAALGIEEVIDISGKVLRRSSESVPETLSGPDFIRSTWSTREFGFESVSTFLAKTRTLMDCGGFPDIWRATSDEDLLMVKLTLNNSIAFSTRCAFRKRFYEESFGYSQELSDLARGIREFVKCLDSDPIVLEYAGRQPSKWNELRGYLVSSAWDTYYYRWAGMYKRRLSSIKWLSAGAALPMPAYSRKVASVLAGAALQQVQRFCPQAYTLYRAIKTRFVARGPAQENGGI